MVSKGAADAKKKKKKFSQNRSCSAVCHCSSAARHKSVFLRPVTLCADLRVLCAFWCARRRARWRIGGGPNCAAPRGDSRCEEVPSAEAFKDNICLNKPPSHAGRFEGAGVGRGSCGIRAPTPTRGESEGGGRLFPSLIKERIHGVCCGFVMQLCGSKRSRAAKKKRRRKNRKKNCGLWNTSPSQFARRTFCTFIVLHCTSVIFKGSHRRDNAPNWPTEWRKAETAEWEVLHQEEQEEIDRCWRAEQRRARDGVPGLATFSKCRGAAGPLWCHKGIVGTSAPVLWSNTLLSVVLCEEKRFQLFV